MINWINVIGGIIFGSGATGLIQFFVIAEIAQKKKNVKALAQS